MTTIDLDVLATIHGGVLPRPDGSGCTGPACPRPDPDDITRLPFPGGEPPFQIPGTNQPPR